MNKMLIWFHFFPEEPEVIIDSQLFEQIQLSAFMKADTKDIQSKDIHLKELFNGNFNEFLNFLTDNDSFQDVEVILPAREVLYTRVSVPSKSRNKIMQALPFLLDDLLVSDIDKQFFALGDIKSGQCNIAVVQHLIINKLFEQFKKSTLPVSVMTSEIFQLPWSEGKWSIAFLYDEFIIRTGAQSGVSNSIHNIEFNLRLLLNQFIPNDENGSDDDSDFDNAPSSDSNNHTKDSDLRVPDTITIYASENTDVVNEVVNKIEAIADEYHIDVKIIKDNLLKLALSKSSGKSNNKVSSYPGINLLQGKYAPSNLKTVKIPFQKTLTAVFVVALVSQLIFMGYQWKSLNELNDARQNELEQLYFNTFPDSKRLIDVHTQAENRLKQLQNKSSAKSSFLNLLGVVGNEIRQHKDIKIQNLQYNDGILQLDIQSEGFVFNQLKSSLNSTQNLIVEEKSTSRVSGKVHSIINFKFNEN